MPVYFLLISFSFLTTLQMNYVHEAWKKAKYLEVEWAFCVRWVCSFFLAWSETESEILIIADRMCGEMTVCRGCAHSVTSILLVVGSWLNSSGLPQPKLAAHRLLNDWVSALSCIHPTSWFLFYITVSKKSGSNWLTIKQGHWLAWVFGWVVCIYLMLSLICSYFAWRSTYKNYNFSWKKF